jgi:GntR family transcriptional regulator
MIDFQLDFTSGVPYYRQIIDQIRFGIASGHLAMGEQLPTVRAMAVDLAINPNTVTKAYKELEIQNVLDSQQGTGTFVSNTKTVLSNQERDKKLASICQQYLAMAAVYGFTPAEVRAKLEQHGANRE